MIMENLEQSQEQQPPSDSDGRASETSTMIDERWYLRLKDILANGDTEDVYIPDVKELEKQKELFLSGEIEAPNPLLINASIPHLENREFDLLKLKDEILKNEENETVAQFYRWRLNEEIARVRMYKTSKEIVTLRDQPGHNGNALRALEIRFDRYNKYIYGEPSPKIYSDVLFAIQSKIKEDLTSEDTRLREAAGRLASILPVSDLSERLPFPDSETIKAVKEWVQDDIDGYGIDLENFPDISKAPEIIASFQDSLGKIGAHGWVGVLDDSGRRLITISQPKEKYWVPEQREAKPGKMRELTIHEILTHALSGVMGEKSTFGLTSIGTDRSEKANEGLATARTQARKSGFDDYASLLDHFAVGLARGLDKNADGSRHFRNFRDVYDIIYAYSYYKQIRTGKDNEAANTNAITEAWNKTRMCFRGSGHETKGICNREKLIYREGNIEVWGQLGNNPELMMRLMISLGKVDTNNLRHMYGLHKLDLISKEDLDKIEKTIFAI
jgi:hypothetical protein